MGESSDAMWFDNKGQCPPLAKGHRVFVHLRCGKRPAESWAADGRYGCRWTLTDHPYDIVRWRIA